MPEVFGNAFGDKSIFVWMRMEGNMTALWKYLDALPWWYVPVVILGGLVVLWIVDIVASRMDRR